MKRILLIGLLAAATTAEAKDPCSYRYHADCTDPYHTQNVLSGGLYTPIAAPIAKSIGDDRRARKMAQLHAQYQAQAAAQQRAHEIRMMEMQIELERARSK